MGKEFNQIEYISQYKKDNYKQFNVFLKINEYKDLENILSVYNLSKVDFLRECIKIFKDKKKK